MKNKVFSRKFLPAICYSVSIIIVCSVVSCKPPIDEFMKANKKYFSEHNEELLIRHFFGDEKNGFFVDIGAAEPDFNSTTCYLDLKLGW